MKKAIAVFAIFMLSFSLFAAGQDDQSVSDEVIEINFTRFDHAAQPVQLDSPVIQKIKELTNVQLKIDAIPIESYGDKKSLLMATNNVPDLMHVFGGDIVTFAPQNVFTPLNDLIDEFVPNYQKYLDEDPELLKSKINGELWGFALLRKDGVEVGKAPVIRTDLLEKHNIPVPETWDELADALLKLKQAYPDSYPYTVRYGTLNLIAPPAYSFGNGFRLHYDHDLGKYRYGSATEEFKQELAYFSKLYEQGILNPDYATNSQEAFTANLTSGKSFFFYDNPGWASYLTGLLQKSEPTGKFGLIPLLENQYGQTREYGGQRHHYGNLDVIGANSKHPEEVAKFMNFLYSDEGAMLTSWGIEGEHYSVGADGAPHILPEVLERYMAKEAPLGSYYSDVGVGQLSVSMLYYDAPSYELDPPLKLLGVYGKSQPYAPQIINAPLSTEEAERAGDINSELETIAEKEYDSFIIGIRPISEYDDIIDELIKNGADELVEIYTDAMAAFLEKL